MAAIIVIVLVSLDQFTKALVEHTIAADTALELIPGFFQIRVSQNSGAAWGILADKIWGIYLLTLLSLFLSLLIAYFLKKVNEWKGKLVLGLILAGSLGNLIDRIRFGAVTDFLVFKFGSYYFPSFNLADSCITVGAVLLIIFAIVDHSFLNNLFGFERSSLSSIEADDEN